MKIHINKDFLKKVTANKNEYECPVELKSDQKHIQDMLDNEVKFCTLITGYRGVGKSSFIDDTLKKYEVFDSNYLVVKMNVASYTDYSVFLKRLIRQIYFACVEYNKKHPENNFLQDDEVFEWIESLHIHTFYNITDYYKNEKQKENGFKLNNTIESKVSGKNIFKLAIKQLPECIALFGIWYESQTMFVRFLLSIFYMIAKAITVVIQMQFWKSSVKKEDMGTSVESLYDDEIAEYQLFQALEQIETRTKKKVIFVFDEMDKIEDEAILKQFFHDIKPLLLSNHSDFILLAGRKMEEYFEKSSGEEDTVISGMFSKKIYISLSSVFEMETFWKDFLEEKDACEEESVQKYISKKIIISKGVIRKFINLILMDVRWDSEGTPYIEIDKKEYNSFDNNLIDVLKMLLEKYEISSTEREKDEYLYRLFGWLGHVLNMQDISLEKMVPKEASAEVSRQCKEFLDKLVECNVLEIDTEKQQYKKRGEVRNEKLEEISTEDKNVVKELMRIYDRIAKVVLSFGKIYKFENADYLLDEMRQLDVIEEIISYMDMMDITSIDDIMEFIAYYRQLHVQGLEKHEIEKVQSTAKRAEMEIGILTENLLRMVLKQGIREQYEIQENRIGVNYRPSQFDISIMNKETKRIEYAIECKVYRQIMKGTLDSLKRTINNLKNLREEERPKYLVYLIFVDEIDTERHAMIEVECDVLLETNDIRGYVYIVEWEYFEDYMREILSKF